MFIKLINKLKNKKLIFISIGNSIGTGLVITLGINVNKIGFVFSLFFCVFVSLVVFSLVKELCNLSIYSPNYGSFFIYSSKYVEDGFGFSVGWIYWYNWIITVSADLIFFYSVLRSLFSNFHYLFFFIFLIFLFLVNFFYIRFFFKIEFLLSFLKVFFIFIFLFFSFLFIILILKKNEYYYWYNLEFSKVFNNKNSYSIIDSILITSFSFQGIESISFLFSEYKRKDFRIFINKIFIKICLIYFISVFIFSFLYGDSNLVFKNFNANFFSLLLNKFGFSFSKGLVNFFLFFIILSNINYGIYASTKILYVLSKNKKAPKFFSFLFYSSIPYNSLLFNFIFIFFYFLVLFYLEKNIYWFLLKISSITGFIVWMSIALTCYRFKIGYILQKRKINFSYKFIFFPLRSIFIFLFCLLVIFSQGYQLFLLNEFSLYNFFMIYSGVFLFCFFWLIYKLLNKTHFVPYSNMFFKKK